MTKPIDFLPPVATPLYEILQHATKATAYVLESTKRGLAFAIIGGLGALATVIALGLGSFTGR